MAKWAFLVARLLRKQAQTDLWNAAVGSQGLQRALTDGEVRALVSISNSLWRDTVVQLIHLQGNRSPSGSSRESSPATPPPTSTSDRPAAALGETTFLEAQSPQVSSTPPVCVTAPQAPDVAAPEQTPAPPNTAETPAHEPAPQPPHQAASGTASARERTPQARPSLPGNAASGCQAVAPQARPSLPGIVASDSQRVAPAPKARSTSPRERTSPAPSTSDVPAETPAVPQQTVQATQQQEQTQLAMQKACALAMQTINRVQWSGLPTLVHPGAVAVESVDHSLVKKWLAEITPAQRNCAWRGHHHHQVSTDVRIVDNQQSWVATCNKCSLRLAFRHKQEPHCYAITPLAPHHFLRVNPVPSLTAQMVPWYAMDLLQKTS